jgi:hypothetical protein
LTDRADGLSGYVLKVLQSGSGFELGGRLVAERAVEPGAVVPGDVLDDGAAGRSAGWPGLLVEQLAFDRARHAVTAAYHIS